MKIFYTYADAYIILHSHRYMGNFYSRIFSFLLLLVTGCSISKWQGFKENMLHSFVCVQYILQVDRLRLYIVYKIDTSMKLNGITTSVCKENAQYLYELGTYKYLQPTFYITRIIVYILQFSTGKTLHIIYYVKFSNAQYNTQTYLPIYIYYIIIPIRIASSYNTYIHFITFYTEEHAYVRSYIVFHMLCIRDIHSRLLYNVKFSHMLLNPYRLKYMKTATL